MGRPRRLNKRRLVPRCRRADVEHHQPRLASALPVHSRHEGMRILEVGSREVTGPSAGRQMFAKAEYIGFAYYPGQNVDLVGDAHHLSSYFRPGEKFDIIYSSACFEHFAMP